jgi:hypothetical protein
MTPWEAKLTADNQIKNIPWREDMRRAENRLGSEDPLTEEFIEARDRIPSSVGEAEHRYMQLLRKDRERQTSD